MPQITFAEPARLADEAMNPLEARALHPARRPGHFPRREAEAHADADEPARRQRAPQLADQPFLLRRAERDEHDVGSGLGQRLARGLDGCIVRFLRQPRARKACDAQLWKLTSQRAARALRRVAVTAEEIDAAPLAGGALGQRPQQRSARDAPRKRCALQVRGPHEGHAVGDAQIRLGVQHLHARLLVVAAQEIEVGGDQPAAALLLQRRKQSVEQLRLRA